jgi:hypothetical protein
MAAVHDLEAGRNGGMESPDGTVFCLFMSPLKGSSRHGFAASGLRFVRNWSRPVRRFFVRPVYFELHSADFDITLALNLVFNIFPRIIFRQGQDREVLIITFFRLR